MIEKLFLSFVHDLVKNIGKDFFGRSAEEKKKILSSLDYDILELANLGSDEDFLQKVKDALLLLSSENVIGRNENILLKSLSTFLIDKVLPLYDKISIKFYVATTDDRKALLEKVFNENSMVSGCLKDYFSRATSEEVQKLFGEIIKKSDLETKTVIIQSAHECSPSLKSEIRSHFGNKYYVIFQVNTRLLGGMLVYKDGEIQDSSWLGRISALKTLKKSIN